MIRLLNILGGRITPNEAPPIWLMRQAGRYLPEYRQTRQQAGGFLDLCFTPTLAAEVTLQPIRRFDLDAAIIFSDILVVPYGLGQKLEFAEGEGPLLEAIDLSQPISLSIQELSKKLEPIYEALSLVKSSLAADKALIGFAGSVWTVAMYMVQGKGGNDFAKAKQAIYQYPERWQELMDLLCEATITHLKNQIKAGANVIQLFESWAGIVPASLFVPYVIEPTQKIVAAIKESFPHIPIIGFPRCAGHLYEDYALKTGVNGVSVDYTVPVAQMKKLAQQSITVQGNLDPVMLLGKKEIWQQEMRQIIKELANLPFIANLGHGVLQQTDPETVQQWVNFIRSSHKAG
ncbi:MAG: uroporphyrinogen decarboxylase [Alphaproteobacteria bacterium]